MTDLTSNLLDPDIVEAHSFLQLLDPTSEQFTFQTFDDRKGRGDATLIRILHGTLGEHYAELTRLNRRGAGVFVVVNRTDGKGRKAINITRVRAIWHEDDVGTAITFGCRPSIVVESSSGKCHRYWLVDDLSSEEHRGVMEHMDVIYGSDPNAKDLSRVLRLPGFYHMKGEPFQVSIIETNGTRYSRDELLKAIPPFPVDAYQKPPSRVAEQASNCNGDPLRDPFALAALRDEASLLADTSPGGGKHGGRNHALNIAAGKLGGFVPHRLSADEVEATLFDACIENGLVGDGEAPVWKTIESGLKHGMKNPRWDGIPTTPEHDFEDVKLPSHESTARHPSRVLWIDDEPLTSAIEWLVDEAIPETGIGFLAALPQQGKTFLLIELALCIALGVPFFGREISKRGGVHIIAAEGAYSLAHRVRAAITEKFSKLEFPTDIDTKHVPLTYEKGAPDLLTPKGFAEFIAKIKEANDMMRDRYGVPLRMVAIDTFAQAFTLDDENKSTDVRKATKAMQQIADQLGVAVVSVHHYGKNVGLGMRGSSALQGNADFVLAIKQRGELKLDKCREAQEGTLGYFEMPIVNVGTKPNGAPITSRYIAESSDWPAIVGTVDEKHHNRSQRILDESFDTLEARAKMQSLPADGGPVQAVRLEDLRQGFYARWQQSADANRQAFKRALVGTQSQFRQDNWDGTNWIWRSEPKAIHGAAIKKT